MEYTVQLNGNKSMLINGADFRAVQQWRWYFDGNYAAANIDGVKQRLHTVLLQAPKGMVTDHINRNKLDNRRVNLRVVTPFVNSNNFSNARGFELTKYGRPTVRVMHNYKRYSFGVFPTQEEAQSVYKSIREQLEACL